MYYQRETKLVPKEFSWLILLQYLFKRESLQYGRHTATLWIGAVAYMDPWRGGGQQRWAKRLSTAGGLALSMSIIFFFGNFEKLLGTEWEIRRAAAKCCPPPPTTTTVYTPLDKNVIIDPSVCYQAARTDKYSSTIDKSSVESPS